MAENNDPETPSEPRLEASNRELHKLREDNEKLVKASNDVGQLAERLNAELREERRRGQPDRRRWPRIGAVSRRASQQAR